MKLDDAAIHLEALGNPTRLKIYRALVRAGEAGLLRGNADREHRAAGLPRACAAGRESGRAQAPGSQTHR